MYLVLISIIITTLYIMMVCFKLKDIPYSISDTFYKIKYEFLFTLAMWLSALFLMPAILDASSENTEFAAFLGCAGMMFVGAAPRFREVFEGRVHVFGASFCLLFSQLWIAMNSPLYLLMWIPYVIYVVVSTIKANQELPMFHRFVESKPMFWAEVVAFLTVYMSLVIGYGK